MVDKEEKLWIPERDDDEDKSPLHTRVKPANIGDMSKKINEGSTDGDRLEYYSSRHWEELEINESEITFNTDGHVLTDKPGPIPPLRPADAGKVKLKNAYELFLENGNKDEIFRMGNRPSNTIEFWNNTSYTDIGYHDRDGQYHECRDHLHIGSDDKVFGVIYCITKVLRYDPSIDYEQEAMERYPDYETSEEHMDKVNAVRLGVNRATGIYDASSRVARIIKGGYGNKSKEEYIASVKKMNIPIIIKLWGVILECKFNSTPCYYYHSSTGVVIHRGYGRRGAPKYVTDMPNTMASKTSMLRNSYCVSENIDVIDNEGKLKEVLWVSGITGAHSVRTKKDPDRANGMYVTITEYDIETGRYDKISRKRLSLEEATGILKDSEQSAIIGCNENENKKLLSSTLKEMKEHSIYEEKEKIKQNWFKEKMYIEHLCALEIHDAKIELLKEKSKTADNKSSYDKDSNGLKLINQLLISGKLLLNTIT